MNRSDASAEAAPASPQVERRSLWVLGAGVLVHLLCAWFSVGYYSADEHFQIWEFAGLKTGLNVADELPWEFPTRMRPALQPAMAVGAIRALDATGVTSPFNQVMATRMVTALLSLGCMLLLYRAFAPDLRTARFRRWFFFLSLLLWFLPFQHARFSSETWSGLAFFTGLALVWPTVRESDRVQGRAITWFAAGLLLGLSFIFRYQAGLLIAPLGLWLLFRARPGWGRLSLLVLGGLLALGGGLCVDRWFYGEWTIPAWNYLRLNLLQGKAAEFGTHPWWTYFAFVGRHGIVPISLLILGAFFTVWIIRPGHVVTWTTLTFVLVHTFIGHKELRFLFPLCNIVPFVLVYAAQVWTELPRLAGVASLARRLRPALLVIFFLVNTPALLLASLKPAEPLVYLFRYVYEQVDPASSVLVYSGENPYGRVEILGRLYPELPALQAERMDDRGMIPLYINFYRHRELPLVKRTGAEDIASYADSTYRDVLLAWHRVKLDSNLNSLSVTPLYCHLPTWVTERNYTDWTSRTQVWTLFRLNDQWKTSKQRSIELAPP